MGDVLPLPVSVPSVVVAEVFGPTYQGEGPSLGKRAGFVRLGGCNLHCTWCDTPYTWDATRYDLRAELHRRPVDAIVADIAAMAPQVVILTGGEPLLWQGNPSWRYLLDGLARCAPVEVETNGTIRPAPVDPVARYVVSPKLAHAGDPAARRINRDALTAFAALSTVDRATLKIVVRTPADVREAAALARSVGFAAQHTYVMPEGTSVEELAHSTGPLAEIALQEGLNMTTRLHVIAWGSERSR